MVWADDASTDYLSHKSVHIDFVVVAVPTSVAHLMPLYAHWAANES
jgi:hypothetical protein